MYSRISRIAATSLVDETFYAQAVIDGAKGTVNVDARPSDALNLALLLDVPIFVEATVLEAAACALPDQLRPTHQPGRPPMDRGAESGLAAGIPPPRDPV